MSGPFRTFDTGRELWRTVIHERLSVSMRHSRDGDCREIQGGSWTLTDPERAWINDGNRKASLRYGCAELLWYLSGTDDGWIEHYAPQYKRFLEEDGTAFGAYGKRWADFGQLGFVLREIGTDSRRAVMQCWAPERDIAQAERNGKDVPCTLSLQFLREDDRLNLIVTMRSNDAWLGLPYDMFCFTMIQRLVAGALNLKCGFYTHQAGSMHLYERNATKAANCLRSWTSNGDHAPSGTIPTGPISMFEQLSRAVRAEYQSRVHGMDHSDNLERDSMMRMVVEAVL